MSPDEGTGESKGVRLGSVFGNGEACGEPDR